MSEQTHVPPGTIKRLSNGWSVTWHPKRDTLHTALLTEITDDGLLEVIHIHRVRTSCRYSGSTTDKNPDPCDVPKPFREILKARGYKTAHVDGGEVPA